MDLRVVLLLLVMAASAVVVVAAALTCPGLCPNNTAIAFPDRAYNWSVMSDTFSCSEWDGFQRESYTNDAGQEVCPADDGSRTFWIDMASYCGCEGYTQPLTCSFCPSGNLINPNTLIVAPEGSDMEFSLTCEQAAVATQYVSNENTCFDLKLLFAPSCCDEGQEEAQASATNSSNSSSSSQCSICPTGSTMQNSNRSLFFVGDGLTCQTGQDILDGLDSVEDCARARERFDRLPLDVAAWCGCTGSEPSNSCPFCSRTSGGELNVEEREVSLGNNLTVTCSEADILAPYINDAQACSRDVEMAIRDCCSGVPTASFPSPVPSPSPTFGTSSAAAIPTTARARRRSWASALFAGGAAEALAPLLGLLGPLVL